MSSSINNADMRFCDYYITLEWYDSVTGQWFEMDSPHEYPTHDAAKAAGDLSGHSRYRIQEIKSTEYQANHERN